ncbi:MAG: Lrp/AsnC family transcriptional regulator [Gemmatimonadetes bacterium]|nr:Lrp/AsnC family transcriptional regulator [Gemmatimonadota bacterium]
MTESQQLDRIDRQLVGLLAKNARLSNKELAAAVGLAPSSCLERVRRLISDGVLRAFHAEFDPAALGYGLEAMVAIRLARHSREQFSAFREYLLGLGEVLAVYHMAGENDFLVHVMARDPGHLRDIALDHLITRTEVGHIETWLMFDHVRGLGASLGSSDAT